jgi:hypothetical protein
VGLGWIAAIVRIALSARIVAARTDPLATQVVRKYEATNPTIVPAVGLKTVDQEVQETLGVSGANKTWAKPTKLLSRVRIDK